MIFVGKSFVAAINAGTQQQFPFFHLGTDKHFLGLPGWSAPLSARTRRSALLLPARFRPLAGLFLLPHPLRLTLRAQPRSGRDRHRGQTNYFPVLPGRSAPVSARTRRSVLLPPARFRPSAGLLVLPRALRLTFRAQAPGRRSGTDKSFLGRESAAGHRGQRRDIGDRQTISPAFSFPQPASGHRRASLSCRARCG
jgi:hypothetical protein